MSLLHNSGIDKKVNEHILGSVARIGGHVNQLINYRGKLKVTDVNIVDGGFGKLFSLKDIQSLKSAFTIAKHKLRQEAAYIVKGQRCPRDRKTLILDLHFAMQHPEYARMFDASMSSNVIEHSPNPIFFLLNFYFITREGGYQYHAIPNYRYTFDSYRVPTKIEHIIEDFEKKTWFDDTSHNEDYIMSAVEKSGWQRKFHEKYPVSYPFMHFHVFDEEVVRQMTELMFEDVTVDVIRNESFGDNLVLFRNTLNKNFVAKYSPLIEEYKKFIMTKTPHTVGDQ